MNRRGLSAIIATTLILLITVVAVTFLVTFLIPFIGDSLDKGTECLDYDQYFKFDDSFNFNCKSGTVSYLTIRAESNQELAEEVNGFELEFVDSGSATSRSVQFLDGGVASSPGDREESGFDGRAKVCKGIDNTIEIPDSSRFSTRTYLYDDGKNYNFVNVFPVLKSGTVCEKATDKTSLVLCSSDDIALCGAAP